jgi:2'-5' RNA ligase
MLNPEDPPMDMRVFIAIELDQPGKRAVGKLIEKIGRVPGRVRWVGPEQMHLTLAFLGDVPAERVAEIAAAMKRSAAGVGPFPFAIQGLGAFPDLRHPRVIWVGLVEPSGTLVRLQSALAAELAKIGYPPEERSFHPHLTLARAKELDRQADYEQLLAPRRDFLGPEQLAGEMLLISSELAPTGPIYTVVATVGLGETK